MNCFKRLSILLILSLPLISCSSEPEGGEGESEHFSSHQNSGEKDVPEPAVADITAAHNVDRYQEFDEISFDLLLHFGGKERIRGTYRGLLNSTHVELERKDGPTVAWSDGEVFLWPPDADWPRARFDVMTWYYFLLLPFKLTDQGTILQEVQLPFSGTTPESILRLTFESGTGDAPDDWYLIRRNDSTRLVDAVAYIVTFSRSINEAEENPHAIAYHDYRKVQGIPIPHRWTFHEWSEKEGLGKQLGEAKISNVHFNRQSGAIYGFIPDDAVEVER